MRKNKEKIMSEIFSSVRLKERVLIIVLTLVSAIFVGLIAGAVTYATTDRHLHEFEYQLERGPDGKFDFVGICQYEGCTNPRYVRDIKSGVTQKVKTSATCTAPGVMEFTFKYGENNNVKTYTYTEEIPMESHTYVGEIVTVDGVSTIKGECIYKGCDVPEINIEGATDLNLKAALEGNCYTPPKDVYTYQLNGVTATVTIQSSNEVLHKLNGEPISNYEVTDGVYLYGTNGIVLVGAPALGCGHKAPGYFVCSDCGKAVGIMVGKPDHTFVLSDKGLTKPTAVFDGQATLSCTADGCDVTKKVTLPRAVVDENSTVAYRSCSEGKQILNYTYTAEEFDVTINLELNLPWAEHSYKYDSSKTKAPTLDKDGYAVIVCDAADCGHSTRIVLNKIELDDPDRKNSEVISQATEIHPKKVLYTYVSESYGFTVELEIGIGQPLLTHKYVYELEFMGDQVFDLVGRCHQTDCMQPEVRQSNVPVEVEDTSTCVQFGNLIYTHTTDSGEKYTLTMFNPNLAPHNIKQIGKATNPTPFEDGFVMICCHNEGCVGEVVVVLPKIDLNVNATVMENGQISYYHYYEPLDYEYCVTLTITVTGE